MGKTWEPIRNAWKHGNHHVKMALFWHRFGRYKPGSAIGVGQSVTLHAGGRHVKH